MSKRNGNLVLYLSIWSIFAMAQCVGSIDPMLAAISEQYGISATTALYCSTASSIVGGFSALAMGYIYSRKVSYRLLGTIGGLCMVIGGVAPYAFNSFAIMIIFRCIFGLGMGMLMSMQNPVTTKLVSFDVRAKILGIGTFCGFAMQCILQYLGGVFTDIQWNYGFLVHVVLILPLLMIIFCLPSGNDGEAIVGQSDTGKSISDQSADSHFVANQAAQKPVPGKVYLLCVMWALSFMLIVPLLIGCSFLSNAIIESAKWAGFVSVCFSFGCMAGGLLFSRVYSIFKRRVMTFSFVVGAVGLFGCGYTRSMFMLCIFIFIGGLGMSTLQASMMMVLGLICAPEKVGFASSVMVGLQNLMAFLCSSWENLVGVITGDSLYMPIYIGGVVYLVFAILMAVRSPFPMNSARD